MAIESAARFLNGLSERHEVIRKSRIVARHVTNPLLIERRFQAFCVGAPKTGTHSLAALFERSYRVEHEAEARRLVQWHEKRAQGRLTSRQIERRLRWRDRRLWLELESSHLLGFAIEELVRCFPNAKFILTIRDCYSWLDSWVNHEITYTALTDYWRRAREQRFDSSRACPPEETELRKRGLSFSLDAYLSDWVRHTERVLAAVPSDRLLIVRTPEIRHSAPRLAEFLHVDPNTLSLEGAHSFRNEHVVSVADLVDPTYLRARFEQCQPLMRRYFPGIEWPMKRQTPEVRTRAANGGG